MKNPHQCFLTVITIATIPAAGDQTMVSGFRNRLPNTLLQADAMVQDSKNTSTFPTSMKSLRNIWHAWRRTMSSSWQYWSSTCLLSKTSTYHTTPWIPRVPIRSSDRRHTVRCPGLALHNLYLHACWKSEGTTILSLWVRKPLVVYAVPLEETKLNLKISDVPLSYNFLSIQN